MVTIFYSRIYYYVSSFHPRLLNTLQEKSHKQIQFVDVSNNTIAQIETYVEKSETVIIDNSIIWCILKESNKDFNFYIQLYNKQFDALHFKSVADYLFGVKKKKGFWFHGDSHGIDVSNSKRMDGLLEYKERIIKNTDIVIVAIHPNKFEASLDSKYLDDIFLKLPNPSLNITDITKNKIVIEIPHCVDIKEAISCKKKWDVCIPGVSYKTRKIAEESINAANLKILPFKKISKLKYYFDVIVNKFLSTITRNELGYKFIRRLSASSKINFICGSGYKYFVRKFLEIPLYNTAMICYPVKNMEDYGFVNGKHAIFCNPEDVGEACVSLLKNPALIDELAKNAYNLIAEKHTVTARATQLIKALEFLAEDKLVESYFKAGEYFYETK
jgi:glycosyltransferase involved in cell wall biosynthesis